MIAKCPEELSTFVLQGVIVIGQSHNSKTDVQLLY